MRYCIVAIDGHYRGIERDVIINLGKKSKINKKIFDELMNLYFDYIDEIQRHPSREGIDFLLDFYHQLAGK